MNRRRADPRRRLRRHTPTLQDEDFDLRFRLELDFFRARGTLAPFFRASDSPMAMACSRLLTLPPRPDCPRRRLPFLRRRMALSTLLLAPLLYLRRLFFRDDAFLAAIGASERKGWRLQCISQPPDSLDQGSSPVFIV